MFQNTQTNNKKSSHGEERNRSPGLLKYISENVLFSTRNYEKGKKHKLRLIHNKANKHIKKQDNRNLSGLMGLLQSNHYEYIQGMKGSQA